MEIRKVQSTASGSFFITLPKPWVNEYEIDKGEELKISLEDDGSLKILPFKTQKKYHTEFIIKIEDYPSKNSLQRAINSCYIQGADIITVESKNTITITIKDLIIKTTAQLIGTEISEEYANKINIRILVDPLKFPYYNLIKRIYTLVHSMYLDAMKSFKENDEVLAKDVMNRANRVNKLYLLMLRQLNLSLTNRLNLSDICLSDQKIDCFLGIIMSRDLSKMAHYAFEIAKQATKLKGSEIDSSIKEHLATMSRFIIKMQQNAILSFFKNNFMRANEVIEALEKVRELDMETDNIVLNKIKEVPTIIGLITISRNLRNIANSASEVAEDLQGKYRPETINKIELNALEPIEFI